MRRRERLEKQIVRVTVSPFFVRLKRFDNRMIGRMEMFSRVFILRLVAAADVSARFAQPQVQPVIARFQTFLAAFGRVRRGVFYLVEMRAFVCHFSFPSLVLKV